MSWKKNNRKTLIHHNESTSDNSQSIDYSGNDLNVDTISNLNHDYIDISTNLNTLGNLYVQQNSTIDGNIIVKNNADIYQNLNVSKSTIIQEDLNVTEISTFIGEIRPNGGIVCNNDKFIVEKDTGNTTVGGTLTTIDNMFVSKNANIAGELYVNDNVTFYGTTYLSNVLKGNQNGGILNVDGNTNLSGILNANGGILCNTDKLIIEKDTGNTTINGTMTLNNTFETNGNTIINGNININSPATINNTLGVAGTTTLNNTLGVLGDTTIYGQTLIYNIFAASGDSTFSQKLNVNGQLNSNGGIVCNTDKFIIEKDTGNTTIAGDLAVNGNTTLTGQLNADGIVCNSMVSNNNTSINGTLTVLNDISENGSLLKNIYNGKSTSWSGNFTVDSEYNFTIDIDFNTSTNRIINFTFDVMYNGSSANGGRDTYFKHRYAFNKYTDNVIPITLDKEYMSNDYDIFTTFIATGTPVTKNNGTTSDGSAGTGRIQINIKPPLYTDQPKIYSKVFVDIFTNDDNDFDVTTTNVTIGNSNTDITDENPLVNYIAGASWNAPNKTVFGGYVGIGTEPNNNARLQVHDGGFSVTGYSDQGRNLYTSTTPGVHVATHGNNSSPHGFIELVSAGESGSWIDFKDNTNNNTNTDYEGRIRYASGGSLSGMSLSTNSTEKMRIGLDGNIGIGTTTPEAQLELSKSGGTTLSIVNPAGNYSNQNQSIEFKTNYATTGFIQQESQNLKIGTTGTNTNGGIKFYTTPYDSTGGTTGDREYIAGRDFYNINTPFIEQTYDSNRDNPQMVINGHGNVGIGNTNPTQKLDVNGNINLTGSIFINGQQTNIIAGNAGQWDTTNNGGIQNSGPVGINNSNPAYTLDVGGDVNFTGNLLQNGSVFTSNKWLDGTTSGNIYHDSGNVGIGTNTPEEKLQVNGNIYLNGEGTNREIIFSKNQNNTNDKCSIHCDGSNMDFYSDTSIRFFESDFNNLGFTFNLNFGRLGIGISDPTEVLDVNGSIKLTGQLNSDSGIICTDKFIVEHSTGNVGIGTITPKAALQVFNNNGAIISSQLTTGVRTATLRLGSPYQSNHDAYCAKITSTNNQSNDYRSDLRFYTSVDNNASATERMCIESDGNVGIGTSTPNEKLVVNGTTKATEFVGNGVTPIGGIIMWSGNMDSSGSPEGYSNWKICDGTSHTVQGNVINTPNLQDRFIVGSGSTYSIGNTGGANSVTLTTSEIPSHSHSMNNSGAHLHEINNAGSNSNEEAIYSYFTNNVGNNNADIGGGDGGNNQFDLAFNGYSSHKQNSGAHTHTINSTGGGSSHENRPPYYALAFIMRIY